MDRGQILENAYTHTKGDRDVEYGSPFKNLTDCAMLWSTYLSRKYNRPIALTAEDVAHMNQLQKIARTFSGKVKMDTYEDNAAYAAIAGECAATQEELDRPSETMEGDVPAFLRRIETVVRKTKAQREQENYNEGETE